MLRRKRKPIDADTFSKQRMVRILNKRGLAGFRVLRSAEAAHRPEPSQEEA